MALERANRRESERESPRPSAWIGLALFSLCVLTYWPAFDNGFIADDYVFLERVKTLASDPLYLFSIPPENFRTTTYLSFLTLQWFAGPEPRLLYAFTILLHFGSCLLLWRVGARLNDSEASGVFAAACFATIQNPIEAVMWLGGMHEAWQGLLALATILLWMRERYVAAAACYVVALFSKESAPVVLLLLACVEVWRGHPLRFRRRYWLLLAPTLLWLPLFAATMSDNSLAVSGLYSLGPHGAPVFAWSLHRLAFPWLYLAVVVALAGGMRTLPRGAAGGIAWACISLLPYVFLTYQPHVPSRHLYLAAMGVCLGIGELMRNTPAPTARRVFLAAFVAVNVGYVWIPKDRQFEARAAVTGQLLRELERRPPGRLLILDFPYNPWVAKTAALHAPGWGPELILVNEPRESCPDCVRLRWDPNGQRYREVARGGR